MNRSVKIVPNTLKEGTTGRFNSYPAYMKIDKSDRKFFVERGEAGFSPTHNKWVIDRTIQKYEATRAANARAYKEQVRERTDAVATYLKSKWAESNNPIERYFSGRELAHLRGQKRIEKIKTLMNGKKYIEFEEV